MVCLDRKIRISRLLLGGYHILYIHMTNMYIYIYTHIFEGHTFLPAKNLVKVSWLKDHMSQGNAGSLLAFDTFYISTNPVVKAVQKALTEQRNVKLHWASVLCKEIDTTIFTGKDFLFWSLMCFLSLIFY